MHITHISIPVTANQKFPFTPYGLRVKQCVVSLQAQVVLLHYYGLVIKYIYSLPSIYTFPTT